MTRGPYKSTPQPGTFADLIMRFRQSPRFKTWGPATRAKNDKVLADFMAANGRELVSSLRRGDVIAMRDSLSDTPGAANNWMKVVKALLAYAVDLEMVPLNVAREVPRLKPAHRDGFRVWREDEIAAFVHRWRADTLPHRALQLMLCTGAAVSDAVKLGPANVRGDRIVYRRNKTGVEVDVPILPALALALSFAPPGLTYLQTAQGRQRSSQGLGGSLRLWAAQAGLGEPDKNGHYLAPHGLRKAMGRRLAEAGVTPHGIMAVLGHEDIKQVLTYTKSYDRARAADEAAKLLGAGDAPKVVRMRKRGE
jgi:integrase